MAHVTWRILQLYGRPIRNWTRDSLFIPMLKLLIGFSIYAARPQWDLLLIYAGADPGGGGPGARAPPPWPPKMRPQHQNSTKLRPQNGSFRPVTIWGPPSDQILDPPLYTYHFRSVYQSIQGHIHRCMPSQMFGYVGMCLRVDMDWLNKHQLQLQKINQHVERS